MTRGRWIAVATTLVAVLVAAVLIVVASDDGGDEEGQVTTTSTTTPTSTSSSSTTVAADTATAVWPFASSSTRYDDPVAAARGFAVDFAGFTDPVVGEFRQGDVRSGEVEVRPRADGPATTLFVRQLGTGDTWWVLGSGTENIVLDQPSAGEGISSPVRLTGQARAFEGTVEVEVREDGSARPLGTGTVTGSGGGELGPFSGEISFDDPDQPYGALVLTTHSGEDGRVWEAGVVRIAFSAAAADVLAR